MAIFRLSPLADADLNEIWDFISVDSDETADKFIVVLTEKFELLANHPLIGRTRNDFKANLRSFPYGSYNIYYFPTDFGVLIYRVLHAARDITAILTEETE